MPFNLNFTFGYEIWNTFTFELWYHFHFWTLISLSLLTMNFIIAFTFDSEHLLLKGSDGFRLWALRGAWQEVWEHEWGGFIHRIVYHQPWICKHAWNVDMLWCRAQTIAMHWMMVNLNCHHNRLVNATGWLLNLWTCDGCIMLQQSSNHCTMVWGR